MKKVVSIIPKLGNIKRKKFGNRIYKNLTARSALTIGQVFAKAQYPNSILMLVLPNKNRFSVIYSQNNHCFEHEIRLHPINCLDLLKLDRVEPIALKVTAFKYIGLID